MQATDRDTKGTDAWKVNYVIHGKSAENFRINTNPETNEGVLYVTKVLLLYIYIYIYIRLLFKV